MLKRPKGVFVMRLALLGLSVSLLLLGSSAQANTINFGTPTFTGSCSVAGNAADRSCTNTASVTNGANDATASANFRGQASADHGVTTNPTAIADITVSYTVPITITRTVSVQRIPTMNGPDVLLTIPNQQITLDLSFTGQVSKDNSQATGGLGQAVSFNTSVSSARFGAVNLATAASQLGGGGLARTNLNATSPDITGNLGRNASGPGAGEISFAFQIPADYRDWDDFNAPWAIQYDQIPAFGSVNFTQTITDTLTISFRLRAESRPSGSVSVTGGEAIACAGQNSPLGGFDLDDAGNCGSGLTVNASVTQTGTTSEAVPEPGTLGLIGLGLAAVAALGSRRRS
jgi:hypothetical protein